MPVFSSNVLGPPHRRATWRGRRALLIGLLVAVILVIAAATYLVVGNPCVTNVSAVTAVLQVRSTPIGAQVVVDGRPRGRTPMTIHLSPGRHQVTIHRDGYADEHRAISLVANQTQAIAAALWLSTPSVEKLRTVFPGTSIVDAGFLVDGRAVITIAVPPTGDREVWVIDPHGKLQQIGPPDAKPGLAASPDGTAVAYLRASQDQAGLTARRYDEVWISRGRAAPGRCVFTVPANAPDERLTAVTWAPDGRHLLVVSQSSPGGDLVGGSSASLRTQLLWLNLGPSFDPHVAPTERTTLTLPSAILPESFVWSPRGDQVAFLAQAGQTTALCTVSTDGTGFRYLADVGRDRNDSPPFAPVSWAPDGQRIVYAASTPGAAAPLGWLFSSGSANSRTRDLYTAGRSGGSTRRLGKAVGRSPLWRSDGTIVALDRPGTKGQIVLREIAPDGQSRVIGQIPVKVSSSYGARWDPVHRQAILAVRRTSTSGQPLWSGSFTAGSSGFEFWLVRWSAEGPR